MFQDSLLESGDQIATRRGWSTLAATTLQAALLSGLVILPMLHPEAISPMRSVTPLPELRPPQPIKSDTGVGVRHEWPSPPIIVLRSQQVLRLDSGVASPNDPIIAPALPVASCSHNCNLSALGPVINSAPSHVGLASQQRPFISNLQEGQLVYKIQPAYPPLARATRTQGTVLLAAIISKEGAIENLRVISGHPLLTGAALNAVSQWRFRPYLLNGTPVEVETEITVNFRMGD